MSLRQGGWTLAGILLAIPGMLILFTAAAWSQVVTTEVTDTIYRANGTPAGGSVLISWPAFTTSSGQAVATGSTSATLSSSGLLDVRLTPNAGATPIGTYYTAVYHLDDGSVSREYWVVPVSQAPVHISTIRSTLLPTSVAMQTVSKSYVDTAIAAAIAGGPLDSSNQYVLKSGASMSGPLTLAGDPTTPSQAASKNYVDVNIGAVQFPVFKASGASHAQGAVPDPGATAGITRFLREDGMWTVPAGGVSGSGSTVPGSTLTPGAKADYSFTQATGTVVIDATGNGNHGTLLSGTHTPVWVPNGLSFTSANPYQGVTLPATLNSTMTFEFAVYVNPFPATNGLAQSNQYPVFLTSSLGSSGINLLHSGPVPGAYMPGIFAGGTVRLTGSQMFSGFHVLTYVLGTSSGSPDRVYIDGIEYPYSTQSFSFGLQSGGNYFLGSGGVSPYAQSGLLGTMYRARFFSTALTPAQILSDSLALTNEVAARGAAVVPQQVSSNSPVFHIVGDSISCAWNGSQCNDAFSWSSQLALTNQPSYTRTNWGIYGATIQGIVGSEANRVARRCSTNAGQAIALVDAGINDLVNATPAQTFQYLTGEIQTLKKAGCRVFVGTMLSGGGNSSVSGTPTMDAQKNAYDALILQQAKSAGADGTLDFAANPLLGADGANTNSNFQSDHTHPSATGQQLMAAAASNALNYFFGYNEINPHTVTALPYSMTAGDGVISLAGVAGAGNLTLPDCTGQSGATYRINNPQSAFAVKVTPLNANQLINGIAFGSPVTVPSNGTLTLRDVPNPRTVSGCHWEM